MANGNFAGGNGTSGNPFLIDDAYDFDAMHNNINAFYELVDDIDMRPIANFLPIGTEENPANLRLDGNYYTVKNLVINYPYMDNVGLIGYGSGMVKYLILENASVTGRNYVGAICGYEKSVIGLSVFFTHCGVTGTINGNDYVGGICGRSMNGPEKCFSKGTVKGNNYVGGICGYINGYVPVNAYSEADVIGNYMVGGIVGSTSALFAYDGVRVGIKHYSSGNVFGFWYVGGICGYISAASLISEHQLIHSPFVLNKSIIGTFFVGDIASRIPLFHKITAATITTVHIEETDPYDDDVVKIQSPKRITPEQAKQKATYVDVGWDFWDVWRIDEGKSFPYFEWENYKTNKWTTKCKSTPFPLNMRKMTVN